MANKGVITDNTKDSIPTIVMITPTYARWTQKADLIRLCQTLMHVDNLMWIVVEDSINKTDIVKRLLVKCKVNYIHLNVRTAQDLQLEVLIYIQPDKDIVLITTMALVSMLGRQ